MDVFNLMATLGLDASAYEEGLENAEKQGSNFGGALKVGAGIAVGAMALTTTAVVGATKAFSDGIAETAAYGDTIDKMSQKMGMSAEAYQEWDAVMQHCGTSIETMKAGMKTLASAAETGNEAFEKLGISQEDIANMSQEELFAATIEGLQNVEDTTERTYLAGQLLGKGATELGALLNTSAEETQAMKDRVHELGGVMSDEAVKAAAAYTDSLQDLTTSFSGLKNNLMSEFLPSITTVMDGLTQIMIGDSEGGLAMINEGVNDFVSNLTTKMPEFFTVGASIIESILTAITQNLPTLIESGQEVLSNLISGIISNLPALLKSAMLLIKTIATALLDNLPQLASVALQLIIELANGLTENLPTLVPALVSVVHEIVSVLTQPDMLSLLITAALQLILALVQGIALATPELIGMIPEIMGNVILTMINVFPTLIDAVVQLLGQLGVIIFGIVGGLMGMNYDEIAASLTAVGNLLTDTFANIQNWFANLSTNLTSAVSGMWNSIVSFFTNGLDEAYGVVTGVLTSISDTFTSIFDGVMSTVQGAIDYIKGLFDFEWSLPDIKLPHFSISGSLDLLATPPTYPTVSVEWYKKGYSDAYILNGATIFGAQGGSLLGGGEGTGGEVVVGTSKLIAMMSEAVREAIGSGQTIIVPVYIGNEKIDEVVVKSNQRNDYISGGR